jgi:triosephosphate isomerase
LSKYLIINFKNYPEIQGKGVLELARIAKMVSENLSIRIIVCPPHPTIAAVSWEVGIEVFSQNIDLAEPGQTTGYVVAEIVREAGASGTLLNHSEHPLGKNALKAAIKRARDAGLKVCLCVPKTSRSFPPIHMKPEFIAIEPPELIGTGVSVSKAKPEVVSKGISDLRARGYKGKILCGAGITSGTDVRKAVELGVEGVLVSSSVVKARDWKIKIEELGRELV